MSLTLQKEPLDAVRDEIGPLTRRHWDFAEDAALTGPFDPHWLMYEAMEEMGSLKIYTARNGSLVGYVVYILGPSLHSKDELVAQEDIIFLHPDYRQGMAALKLMRFALADLEALGATGVNAYTKLDYDVGVLFERLGFTPTERMYYKRLNG